MRTKHTLALVVALCSALFIGGMTLASAREAEPGDDRTPTVMDDSTTSTVDDSPNDTVDDSTSTTVDSSTSSTIDDNPSSDDATDDHGRNRGSGSSGRDDGTTSTTVRGTDDDPADSDKDGGVHQCRGCDDGADDGPDAADDGDDDGRHRRGHDDADREDNSGHGGDSDDNSGPGRGSDDD
jgi:hypothetical protein